LGGISGLFKKTGNLFFLVLMTNQLNFEMQKSDKLNKTYIGFDDEVSSIEFSSKESYIASGLYENRNIIWKTKTEF
jgi:WD40 repeat protein